MLDDPISSFDQNKKYAIIQRLFSARNGACKDVTTLLLTHDLETLVMLQRIHKKRVCAMSFWYVCNPKGDLVLKDIEDGDLGSVIGKLTDIASSDVGLPLRISSARRVLELKEGKSAAWSVLSSLAHGKTKATIESGNGSNPLSDEEWVVALAELEKVGFPDFDYDSVLEGLSIEKLVSAYHDAASSAEKICAFRILTDVDSSKMKVARDAAGVSEAVFEFANEFFHVENLMVFQLDLTKYDMVPAAVVKACDAVMAKYVK